MTDIISKSEKETKKLGFLFGSFLFSRNFHLKNGKIFALKGTLGSGKTTFLKGVAKGLKIKEKIKSPSFLIFRKFFLPQKGYFFYHFDCYRIKNSKEILDLGFFEILKSPSLVFIEWAEKIKKILPSKTIWIEFSILGERERKIKFFNSKIRQKFLEYIKKVKN